MGILISFEICNFELFLIFLPGFARASIEHDPILYSASYQCLVHDAVVCFCDIFAVLCFGEYLD
jgi:hypothetical protein